ncbi:MAG: hypothetical protein IT544_04345 [Rhodobacteraceae bacterium]|nr:hypothetical protein [Paracoccaceae bacterium]
MENNSEFRTHRYSLPKRLIRLATSHPKYTITIVTLLYLGVILLAKYEWLYDFNLICEKNDFGTINIAFLTVQTTLVGIVFPIVISFVGMFNQGKASFTSRFTIYIETSNAILIAVSSLILCVVIATMLLVGDESSIEYGLITLLNLIWLVLNIFLIGDFLLHTIHFLHPIKQTSIIKAYVANVVWPRELTRIVTYTIDGYLPKSNTADRSTQRTQAHVILASATLPLNRITHCGFKRGLKFCAVATKENQIDETVTVLREIITDFTTLIDTRQANTFTNQLHNIEEFHTFLYRLAQSPQNSVNYAQYPINNPTLAQSWVLAYQDMICRAVELLPIETKFINEIALIPARIYEPLAKEVTPEALQPLLSITKIISYRLMDWAHKEHLSEIVESSRKKHAFTLSRQKKNYTDAWCALVDGWEKMLGNIARIPDSHEDGHEDKIWKDLERVSENIVNHLLITMQMASHAVDIGDEIAKNWTCDLILHWNIYIKRALDGPNENWLLGSEQLTFEMVKSDWTKVKKLLPNVYDETPTPQMVFSVIINNTWRDHATSLAILCVHWAISNINTVETTTQAAHQILHGKPHDLGDINPQYKGAMSSTSILISALQITRYNNSNFFDTLIPKNSNKTPRIPGRIYNAEYTFLKDLSMAQALLMMATTSSSTEEHDALRHLLTQTKEEIILERWKNHLKELLTKFKEIDENKYGSLLCKLIDSDKDNSLLFEKRKENAQKLVEKYLNILKNHHEKSIIDA